MTRRNWDGRGGFWERNDQMLAGEMHPMTQAIWVAAMAVIGVATMAMLWVVTRCARRAGRAPTGVPRASRARPRPCPALAS